MIPAADQAGVRLGLHPNDPPAPVSRGSQQIMATLAGWKKLIEIVKSGRKLELTGTWPATLNTSKAVEQAI